MTPTPTTAEIESWARRERSRRQQWAAGPTPEQAALWATLQHERRLAARDEQPPGVLRRLLTTSVSDAFDYVMQTWLDAVYRVD